MPSRDLNLRRNLGHLFLVSLITRLNDLAVCPVHPVVKQRTDEEEEDIISENINDKSDGNVDDVLSLGRRKFDFPETLPCKRRLPSLGHVITASQWWCTYPVICQLPLGRFIRNV